MSVKFVSLSIPVWRGPQVVVVVGEDLLAPPDDLVSHESDDHSKEGMFDHLKVAVSLVTELVVDLVAEWSTLIGREVRELCRTEIFS